MSTEFQEIPTAHNVTIPVAAHCKTVVPVDFGEVIQLVAGQSNPDGFQVVTSFAMTRTAARELAHKILEYTEKRVH